MLKSVAQLKEAIAKEFDRAQAILDLAVEEKRELTAEDKAEIDRINGKGKKGESGYAPGTIDSLEEDLARAERIESRSVALGAARGTRIPMQSADSAQETATLSDRISIPVQSRYRYGALKSFKGPKAEEKAYIAGRFFLAVLAKHQPSLDWCNENGLAIKNAMTGTDNQLGGYLVPVELEQTIIDLREQYAVVRKYSSVKPMQGDTKNVPVRKSGLTAYFGPVDTSGITNSDKAWGNAQLVAKDLYCLTRVSNNLNDDAVISVGDDIASEVAQAFAYSEDNAAFNGDGGSTYGGIVGILNAVAAGAVSTAATGHDTWAEIDMADMTAAIGKLAHYAGMQPAWFVSKPFWSQVMLRLLAAGGGNTMQTLQQGQTAPDFLGYPVVLTQVLPTATGVATKCAVLGDLNLGTVFGNRRGMGIALSEHSRFAYDQLEIRGHERFDFNCHSIGTASTAGALVVLKTAS